MRSNVDPSFSGYYRILPYVRKIRFGVVKLSFPLLGKLSFLRRRGGATPLPDTSDQGSDPVDAGVERTDSAPSYQPSGMLRSRLAFLFYYAGFLRYRVLRSWRLRRTYYYVAFGAAGGLILTGAAVFFLLPIFSSQGIADVAGQDDVPVDPVDSDFVEPVVDGSVPVREDTSPDAGDAGSEGKGRGLLLPTLRAVEDDGAGRVSVTAFLRYVDERRVERGHAALTLQRCSSLSDFMELPFWESLSAGVHRVDYGLWQYHYSQCGGYQVSEALAVSCADDYCSDFEAWYDAGVPVLGQGIYRSIMVAAVYDDEQSPRYVLLAPAAGFLALEVDRPFTALGEVNFSGSVSAGANVGTISVSLWRRDVDSDAPGDGELVVQVLPELPTGAGNWDLAERWEVVGDAFTIVADVGDFMAVAGPGQYRIQLKANTGSLVEPIGGMTVRVEEVAALGTFEPTPTLTPEPTVRPTVTPGPPVRFHAGVLEHHDYSYISIAELSGSGYLSGQPFLLAACHADGDLPTVYWPEGIPFTPDGKYGDFDATVIVQIAGGDYPPLGQCHRLYVRYEGHRPWEKCRDTRGCGDLRYRSGQAVVPYFYLVGYLTWEVLPYEDQCGPYEVAHAGCWKTD